MNKDILTLWDYRRPLNVWMKNLNLILTSPGKLWRILSREVTWFKLGWQGKRLEQIRYFHTENSALHLVLNSFLIYWTLKYFLVTFLKPENISPGSETVQIWVTLDQSKNPKPLRALPLGVSTKQDWPQNSD